MIGYKIVNFGYYWLIFLGAVLVLLNYLKLH